MLTYEEFVVLAALNLWLKEGLPADYVVSFAASTSEVDPRGTVAIEQCQKAFNDLLQRGWTSLGKASDASDRTFAYSTPQGTAEFEKSKDFWNNQRRRTQR